jgi:two-component system, NtrC family, nitrogen regulation response regulator NtrX
VILIHVPSLNERAEDVPVLTDFFITKICDEYGVQKKEIEKTALEELKKVNWTGNIRELRNVVERLIILCPNKITANEVKAYANPK